MMVFTFQINGLLVSKWQTSSDLFSAIAYSFNCSGVLNGKLSWLTWSIVHGSLSCPRVIWKVLYLNKRAFQSNRHWWTNFTKVQMHSDPNHPWPRERRDGRRASYERTSREYLRRFCNNWQWYVSVCREETSSIRDQKRDWTSILFQEKMITIRGHRWTEHWLVLMS